MTRSRAQAVVALVEVQRIADQRRRPIADRIAQETARAQRIALAVEEEGPLIKRHVIDIQPILQRGAEIFGEQRSRLDRQAGRRLLERRFAAVVDKIERIEIAAKNASAKRNRPVEKIGFGKIELGRFRKGGIIDAGAENLSLAAKIPLLDRSLQEEVLDRREARRQRQLAGRFFLDIRFQDDAIRSAAFLLFDLQVFLEIAQGLDPAFRPLEQEAVERIALGETKLAAHHLVLGQRVAVDINPLDINARAFGDLEGDPHRQIVFVACIARRHVGKGVAEQAGGLAQRFDGILDALGVEPVALLDGQTRCQRLVVEIADGTVDLDVAEFVSVAFFHHIGDDEILLVAGLLGHRRYDTEIGIALGQIEFAQLGLVKSQAVGVVARVRRQKRGQPRLFGGHLTAQLAI